MPPVVGEAAVFPIGKRSLPYPCRHQPYGVKCILLVFVA